jgi:hypothetical protein
MQDKMYRPERDGKKKTVMPKMPMPAKPGMPMRPMPVKPGMKKMPATKVNAKLEAIRRMRDKK